MHYKFPVYRPSLSGNEKKYVLECLESSWISSKGEFIAKFETEFARFIGVEHAASVSNGTVALHLALMALGIGPGDEVIVPTLTYVASVNAIRYCGAQPVFVDSVASTWQMSPEDVARKISGKTKAILAVHLYGQACDMTALSQLAKEHSLFLVEDCAEALGTSYQKKHVGTFGDISTFSFFGNKTITTGEGGMVVTRDRTLYERSLRLKGQGLAQHREYWHDIVGYNYRMTNVCAAIGLAQLEQIDKFLKAKRAIAEQYHAQLKGLPIELHREAPDTTHSYWMVSMLVNDPTHREPLREHLKALGIETRPLFYPVHTMPMYSSDYDRHVVAENLGWRGINLPSYPALSPTDVKTICDAVKAYFS